MKILFKQQTNKQQTYCIFEDKFNILNNKASNCNDNKNIKISKHSYSPSKLFIEKSFFNKYFVSSGIGGYMVNKKTYVDGNLKIDNYFADCEKF